MLSRGGGTMDDVIVRDIRRAGWFWAENEVIDNHLHAIGDTGFTVYMVLVRYANNQTNTAIISLAKIAEKIGKSKSTVKRVIKLLEKEGLITIERERKRPKVNEVNKYSLCAVKQGGVGSWVNPRGVMGEPRVGSWVNPDSRLIDQDSSLNKREDERNKVAPSAPKNDLQNPPTGYLWITSSISTEKYIHLSTTEKGKILCGASLKHRTTDYQHTGANTPCPECLKAAEKPKSKMEQPSKEIKDRFAQICFGQAKDLTPATWGLIVKAWNQMGKPDLVELKALEDAWYKHDWRGKKGERPKPLQLSAERDSLKAKNVPPPKREHFGVQLTAAQQELYAKYPILERFPASEWAWRVREENFR